MSVLDTHSWIWWVNDDERLTSGQRTALEEHREIAIGVSAISCWEVAKRVEIGRLVLRDPVLEWLDQALAYPGCRLLQLTPPIVVESTQLPGKFHRDPADQIIVATARVHRCGVLTADRKILDSPHVQTLDS